MSNIYLDRLDRFVEQQLIPEYTQGTRRRSNPAYQQVTNEIARETRHGNREAVRRLRSERRTLPSQDPNDPGYRRLRDVRYCDDFLLGFAGPKHEAEQIKSKIRAFLREELELELSEPKTLITHATSQAARFLGYEIRTQHADDKITRHRRAVNGAIGLFVPKTVIRERCARYMSKGKPAQRGPLLFDDDFTIVATYGSEYRGFVQYYLMAQDIFRLQRLQWVMETSMLKTLAGKHKSTVTKMARKYKTTIDTGDGPRTCFQVTVAREDRKALIARFGGIPLARQRTAIIVDRNPPLATANRNELIHRLLAEKCELCESPTGLQVHHVRKLADLDKPGRPDRPAWIRLMAKRRRKTLVVCRTLPPGHPRWTGHCHHPEIEHWRAGCGETPPVRFGKRPSEKDPSHGHLVGGPLHS
ncbi:group II intron reverse transcriptase/maturase, partial [Nocardia sp. NPDC004750]